MTWKIYKKISTGMSIVSAVRVTESKDNADQAETRLGAAAKEVPSSRGQKSENANDVHTTEAANGTQSQHHMCNSSEAERGLCCCVCKKPSDPSDLISSLDKGMTLQCTWPPKKEGSSLLKA